MSFPLMSIAAYNALVLGLYSNATKIICHSRYGDSNQSASFLDMTIASMIAGAASVSIGSPIDLVKIRLQAQTETTPINQLAGSTKGRRSKKFGFLQSRSPPVLVVLTTVTTDLKPKRSQALPYKGVVDCVTRVYKEVGIKGFYKGGGQAMLIRDVPGYVNYFLPYFILSKAFSNPETGETGPLGFIIAGGLAGVWSWGIMHPVDTVKSRIQLEGQKYKGVFHCATKMYRNDGAQVFIRGIGVNALRGFPQSAAMFFGYEMSMKGMSD